MMSTLGFPLGGSSRRAGDEGQPEKAYIKRITALCAYPSSVVTDDTFPRGGRLAFILTHR